MNRLAFSSLNRCRREQRPRKRFARKTLSSPFYLLSNRLYRPISRTEVPSYLFLQGFESYLRR
jgi:hypothetical protein